MNILFITHRRPAVPGKGDQVRCFQQMQMMKKRGHTVHCLFQEKNQLFWGQMLSDQGEMKEMSVKKTRVNYLSILRSFCIKQYPLNMSLHSFPYMPGFLEEVTTDQSYDVIHIQSKVFHNFPDIEHYQASVIVDYIDAISLNLKRRYDFTKNVIKRAAVRGEFLRMRKYEEFLKNRVKKAIITSPIDRNFIKPERADQIQVVPNFIDLDHFYWNKDQTKKEAIVFTGTMSYAPNVDAAIRLVKHIFPALKQKFPQLECWIVGAHPTAEVKKLAEVEGVIVTGFVDDIRDWQWEAAVYVCPLRFGAGQQNKILEAAALGCPIVMSEVTNGGIGFEKGIEAAIAGSDEEFVEYVEQMLKNRLKSMQMAARAREFVVGRYSEEIVANQLAGYYGLSLTKKEEHA